MSTVLEKQRALIRRKAEIFNDPRYLSGSGRIRRKLVDEMLEIAKKLSELNKQTGA